MGFFSKDKSQNLNEANPSATVVRCNVCNGETLNYSKQFKLGTKEANNIRYIDISDYLGDNTGVCSNCGIVVHGQKLYESKNMTECNELYGIMRSALLSFMGSLKITVEDLIKKDPSKRFNINEVLEKVNQDTIALYKKCNPEIDKGTYLDWFLALCINYKFAKKQGPNQENNPPQTVDVVSDCPICNSKNGFKTRWEHTLKFNEDGAIKEKRFYFKPYFGSNVGVCQNCGIVLQDKVIYKSNDFDKTWFYFTHLTNYFAVYLSNYEVSVSSKPNLTGIEKFKIIQNIINVIKYQIKSNVQGFPEDIDFLTFVSVCNKVSESNK